MTTKTLAIILAAGVGNRVSHLYTDDEPNKPMLKIGDKRLIEINIELIKQIGIDCAVLTYPNDQYHTLHEIIKHHNVRLLYQTAKQRKLPSLLELPYILAWQYYFSCDRKYLRSFDHVITLPCDMILNKDDMKNMISTHKNNHHEKIKRKITILSKPKKENEHGDLFLLEKTRIMALKKYSKPIEKGWIATNQAGVYMFSQEFLRNPYPLLLGAKHVFGQMYIAKNGWIDYGEPANFIDAIE